MDHVPIRPFDTDTDTDSDSDSEREIGHRSSRDIQLEGLCLINFAAEVCLWANIA